jgi:hypothetical protein
LTSLSHKTQYWYKAYVKLDSQTFYGEVKTFTTDVVPVESVSLDKTEYTFNTIGNTLTLKATVLPADATDKSLSWAAAPNDIIKMLSGEGTSKEFEALSAGNASIAVYALDGSGVKAECKVTVNAKSAVPSGAVDLGITMKGSGGTTYKLYWADSNLGATSPEGNGDYYAWGEVNPKTNYSWSTYKWSNGASNKLIKYCPTGKQSYWDGSGSPDGKIVLDPEDDAAHA